MEPPRIPPRRSAQAVAPLDLVAYAIAALTFVTGALMIEGSVLPPLRAEATPLRYILGVVLMLMGVYRVVLTRARAGRRTRQAARADEDDEPQMP